ncbi:1615_t:CDS:2, partial [Dentiscutata heterogama]
KGKHKGAQCRYCTTLWARERAQDMKAYLGIRCKGKLPREIQLRNTKSELNYVDLNFPQEDFLSIFNKIASSIKDSTDLFGEKKLIFFSKELIEGLLEELLEEDIESLDESDNLDQENFTNLIPKILKNLHYLIKKAAVVQKHLKRNCHDKNVEFRLMLIESRICRYVRFYKKVEQLSPD